MKIPSPQTKQHSVSGKSDLFGTIHYGKNINLDEEGYIKLSSRVVSLFNQSDSNFSNLRLPLAFGRKSVFSTSLDYAITQAGSVGWWLTLINSGNSLNYDQPGAPTLTTDSHGCWFQNLWNVTDDTELYTKADVTDVGTYTAKSASLTSGKVHFLEVFRNRRTICVTNGNTVKQFDTSYSASQTLTLPSDYEAVGLSYSNSKMAIIANLADTASQKGQNAEAYFFVWSGATADAGQGFPVGSDKIIAVVPYKGSWLIVTRKGQIRFFTGGGWDDSLGSLPFYYSKLIWGASDTRDLLGNVLLVDGDVVYLNTNALFYAYGKNYEQYSNENIGGILCLDPSKGLYSRYTPSISPSTTLKVASADVNTTTNVMTITSLSSPPFSASTIPSTGSPIKYISDKTNQIGGLTCPTIYYCIKLSSTTFSLALTREKAEAGVAIDLTSTGASNNYFMALEVYDYGQCYTNTSGGIAELGELTPTHDHLIFGAELNDYNGTGNSNHINITVPDFENRGYVVTPKFNSDGITDKHQRIAIKYRPLKTNDKIIVKVKDKDILGLPISTPQSRVSGVNQCTWTGRNSFYTSANFEDAKTAFDAGVELECEIIAGFGAGVLAKISDISYASGVYAVTLSENIDGAGAGKYSDVLIENWAVKGTITSSDVDGFKIFGTEGTSPWAKYKIELRGSETTIEEIQPAHIVSQSIN